MPLDVFEFGSLLDTCIIASLPLSSNDVKWRPHSSVSLLIISKAYRQFLVSISIGYPEAGSATEPALSSEAWRSSSAENFSPLYSIADSAIAAESAGVADSVEVSASMSVSSFSSLSVSAELLSAFSLISATGALASEDDSEAAPHPIRASIIVVANKIAVVVFFFIGLSFLYSR